MWKPDALPMTIEQRKTLEKWIRAGATPQRMVLRSQICLLAADGRSNNAIAKELFVKRILTLETGCVIKCTIILSKVPQ